MEDQEEVKSWGRSSLNKNREAARRRTEIVYFCFLLDSQGQIKTASFFFFSAPKNYLKLLQHKKNFGRADGKEEDKL